MDIQDLKALFPDGRYNDVYLNMHLIIKPYQGVGPITFGMTMDEARAALGGSHKQFKRGLAKTFTDSFGFGVFVLYGLENTCVGVEMGKPSCPTLFDKRILNRPYCEMEDWLKSKDADLVSSSTGCKSFEFGISIYAPQKKDNLNAQVEAVLVFQKGYYDQK